jgi:hypothetical protein
MDLTSDSSHQKKLAKNTKPSARNDSRKRSIKAAKGNSIPLESQEEEESSQENQDQDQKEVTDEDSSEFVGEVVQIPGQEKSRVQDREESEDEASEEEGPVPERVRKPKNRGWETVDNIRKLTSNAAKIIQGLVAISEQRNLQSLSLLKDKLKSDSSSLANPQKTSLESILQRCTALDVKAIEGRFLQMVALVQLALWLDEYVFFLI